MSNKHFILTTGLTFILFLGIVYTTNWLMNPYLEYEIDIGLRRFWLDNPHYEDRQQKLFLYNRLSEPPEVLILGNSRGQTLPVDIIEEQTGMKAFNASVISMSTYEYVVMSRYFLHQPDNSIKVVIANVDIFDFRVPPADAVYRYPLIPFAPELEYPLIQAEIERLKRTLAMETTMISFELIDENFLHPNLDRQSIDSNGVTYYPNEDGWSGPNPLHVEAILENYRKAFSQQVTLLDSSKLEFESWLEMMEKEGICVNIIVAPFMSDVIDDLKKTSDYERHMTVFLDYLNDLQKEYPIQLFDFSRVDKFGGEDLWFSDGTHFMNPISEKIIQKVIDQGLCK